MVIWPGMPAADSFRMANMDSFRMAVDAVDSFKMAAMNRITRMTPANSFRIPAGAFGMAMNRYG